MKNHDMNKIGILRCEIINFATGAESFLKEIAQSSCDKKREKAQTNRCVFLRNSNKKY